MCDRTRNLPTRASRLAALFAVSLGVAACSAVPDAVNPISWYQGVEGWFESDEDQQAREQARSAEQTTPPLPGSDRGYPNLSTVPERPRSVSTPAERNRIGQSLAADRENARYTDPESARPPAAALGAPAAAPRAPVNTQTVPPRAAPSPDGLERLPMEDVPSPPPAPRSSLDENQPATAARPQPAAPQPAVQQAAFQPDPAAGRPAAVPAVAQSQEPALRQTAALVQPAGRAGASSDALPGAYIVHFANGSAALDGADRGLLRQVADIHKRRGGPLRIIGHASGSGRKAESVNSQITNFRLSSQRADAVARELARLGVPPQAMIVTAVSDGEPAYRESTAAGAAGNRRVEILFGY